ncbi:MAG: site-specific integrase [Bdellovibrionota bacterium]|nr:site-specific integrase [Bdellovibrionota bacterium]
MIKSYSAKGKKLYEVFVKSKDQTGKQVARRKRNITSERKAKDIEFQFKTELASLSGNDPVWTWKKWHEECLKRMQYNRKQSTIAGYSGQLNKWLPTEWKEKEVGQISKANVFKLLFEDIGGQVTEHTRKSLLKMLRRIFEMAVEEGLIATNPTKGIAVKLPQREQKVLTADEAQLFLKAARETDHRFYPIWTLALMTGMRSGEMYALKWSDVDLDAGIIAVNKQWTSKDGFGPTKTREARAVPISPELKVFLAERKLKAEGEFVLPHLREWTNGEQAQVTREFCRSIEITEVKFHDLRATFITNMLAQGVPLVTVMAIVGHRKMSTTDVYLRLAGVNVKGATEKLGYSLPKAMTDNVLQLIPSDSIA